MKAGILLGALLSVAWNLSAQNPAARNDIERLGLKNYPSKEMLIRQFVGLRNSVRQEDAVVILCGPSVLDGLSVAMRRGVYVASMRYADSLVVEPECGALPPLPVRGASVVRIEEIVIGLDSSYVLARSTKGWDGAGPVPWREWVREKYLWVHTRLPGEISFAVFGFNMVRDSPRAPPE